MITLNLAGSAYDRAVTYLKNISSRGVIVSDCHLYQIAKYIGRGVVIASPGEETITLEDNVDREIVMTLLNASKPRRITL